MTEQIAVQSTAARVGIGGPVGSGKTALLEQMIPRLIERGNNIAVVRNEFAVVVSSRRNGCWLWKPALALTLPFVKILR
jgi:urease accessory protein